jgi:hypothetical protein
MINICGEGHHFIGGQCPLCHSWPMASVPYRDGDCIDCGNLCAGFAYACTEPHPIENRELVAEYLLNAEWCPPKDWASAAASSE